MSAAYTVKTMAEALAAIRGLEIKCERLAKRETEALASAVDAIDRCIDREKELLVLQVKVVDLEAELARTLARAEKAEANARDLDVVAVELCQELNHAEAALAHRFIGLEADDEDVARALSVQRAEEVPTADDERLHGAMMGAALWHLIGRVPDGDDVAECWKTIREARLIDLVTAAERVRAVGLQTSHEDGKTVARIRCTIADRLVAACYVAASFDADHDAIVAIPIGANLAKAVVVVAAPIGHDDEDVARALSVPRAEDQDEEAAS